MPNYPALTIELSTSNDFANLSRRDADIALRLTRTPPEHLVGRELAKISYRVCGSERYLQSTDVSDLAAMLVTSKPLARNSEMAARMMASRLRSVRRVGAVINSIRQEKEEITLGSLLVIRFDAT